MWFSPAAGDCVDVGAADSTCLDLNVDIIFFKGLRFELGRGHVVSVGMTDALGTNLLFLEITPILLIRHHEPFERLWISHLLCDIASR